MDLERAIAAAEQEAMRAQEWAPVPDELKRLLAQRAAVAEIHRIAPSAPVASPYCAECDNCDQWPCATAVANGATELPSHPGSD